MLKSVLRRYNDDGQILLDDREIDVTYQITVTGNSNVRRADGILVGLEIVDFLEMLESQTEQRLRLKSGDVVEFIFLGGQLQAPARIAVNTPMPGID